MSRNKVYQSRFSDAPWLFEENKRPDITVGGAGGISSWFLLFLSRTDNYKTIYLYEDDTIDETNMAGQFFQINQIGQSKSSAIKLLMSTFSDSDRINSLGKYDEGDPLTPITITGFDNMKARKDMFEKWKYMSDREIFIDGRMIFEDGQIYCVTKGQEERYEKTLFSDDEVKDEACSMKATTHTGAHIASLMMAFLNNYFTNKYFYEDNIRLVPFNYTFSFPPLLIETDV